VESGTSPSPSQLDQFPWPFFMQEGGITVKNKVWNILGGTVMYAKD
jgi:hypothetical protein